MDRIRRIVLSLLFWGIVIAVVVALAFSGSGRGSADGDVLVLRLRGTLVDTYTLPPSYQGIPMNSYLEETLLRDMVSALDTAASDPAIRGAFIDFDDFQGAGPAAAAELGDAVARFSASGRKVISSAFSYTNASYRIAAPSDLILVDRLGDVFFPGYGSWRMYFGEGLERLGVDVNLFRSGESKTGGENMVRSTMSAAARKDEERLLGSLWQTWLSDVARSRGIPPETLSQWIDEYDSLLLEAQGNGAQAALTAGLVDHVETGGTLSRVMRETFGPSYQHVESVDYLAAGKTALLGDTARIAVVPVSGTLVPGEGTAGQAGSSDIVEAIKTARETRGVKALVLRINSPGGAVTAGEDIRRCVAETREKWHIPVTASMGNLAASGGYWIALGADSIVARPETITGSIGVYSLNFSFERMLKEKLGIQVDGYGTTLWSGASNPGRSLSERAANLYKAGIMDIDRLFRSLVEEKRGLSAQAVAALAGGIPWSGVQALELGLVDSLGGLEKACEAAGELAGLSEWEYVFFDKTLSWKEELLSQLLWNSSRKARRGSTGRGYTVHKKGLFPERNRPR